MNPNPGKIILFGIASEYTYEALEVALRAGVKVSAFVDNMVPVGSYTGLEPILSPALCNPAIRELPAIIPLITPGYRKQVVAQIRELGFHLAEQLIDPTAVLASSTRYDQGFQVNAGVVIGANGRFGGQVLINRSVSIGHDADIGDYASFGPGCVLCGSCRVGQGAFIGGGSTLGPGVSVGSNAIVGAGAVVVKDVPDNTIVIGNPARISRKDIAGYNNVGV